MTSKLFLHHRLHERPQLGFDSSIRRVHVLLSYVGCVVHDEQKRGLSFEEKSREREVDGTNPKEDVSLDGSFLSILGLLRHVFYLFYSSFHSIQFSMPFL